MPLFSGQKPITRMGTPLVALCLMLLFMWLFIAPQPSAQSRKYPMIISHVLHPESPKGEAFTYFAQILRETAGGEDVNIEIYPSSTRYIDVEAIEALNRDAIHFIAPTTSKLSVFVPELAVLDFPFLFEDRESYYRLLEGPYGDYVREKLREHDLRLLAFWDNGFRHFSNAIREVVYPEDLKGLSIRVMSGENTGLLYEHFGAHPKVISFLQMPQMLRLGVVNGAENTVINYYDENLMGIQPYLTLSYHSLMIYTFLMSESYYQSLSPEMQEAIDVAAARTTEYINYLVGTREQRFVSLLEQDERVQIVTLPPGVRDLWRKNIQLKTTPALQRHYSRAYQHILEAGYNP